MTDNNIVRVGFDMDGTLDRPALRNLAVVLASIGISVHVITGMFPEAEAPWQDEKAKREKFYDFDLGPHVQLHIVRALPTSPTRNLDYVLRDLNLQKANLCRRLGISVMIDDSHLADTMKAMCGATILRVL